jgi:hypothetical protein
MRTCLVLVVVWLASFAVAQKPLIPDHPDESQKAGATSSDSAFKEMFEAKVKGEWEAFKNKDKKAYAELLADDYQGVEVDGKGERT